MSSGLEQYGQCSGHWYDSSAISVNGLGAGIDQQSSRRHPVDELAHVFGEIGVVVAGAEHADYFLERALAIAQFEHLRGSRIESHRPLGNQEQMLLADLVVAQSRAGGETRTSHSASGLGETVSCVSPRSIASSCA